MFNKKSRYGAYTKEPFRLEVLKLESCLKVLEKFLKK